MTTITYTERLEVQNCCVCGITFGVPADFDARRRNDHSSFWCPSGHVQSYTGPSEADRLRKQLEAEKARALKEVESLRAREEAALREATYFRNERDGAQKRLRAHKGVITKLKKRALDGRCPCCSHVFKDLGTHMKAEHPDFDPEKAAEAIAAKEA